MCVRVPSQGIVNLVSQIKQQNGSEKANFINANEQQQLTEAVRKMQQSGMSEEQIKTNLEYIRSELQVTNVTANYEIKGADNIGKPGATTFKFDIQPKNSGGIKGFCTDYEQRATQDARSGQDPQYQVLSKDPKNFLIVDQDTGNIRGYYDRNNPNGTVVNKNANRVTTSVRGNGLPLPEGMPTNIKDVIKQDFARYGANLVNKFPNNEDGAKKFLEALSNIPGNKNNRNLTLDNAKELLSYIHTGANTEGKANVQQLQCLLRGMTGETGIDISDKNNPKGGDNAYGYATTLQVRSLDAFIASCEPTSVEITANDKPPLLRGNPVFLIDRSGSMKQETSSLSQTIGKFLEDGGNYRIATYQDSGVQGDLRLVNNGQGMDSRKALQQLTNQNNFSNSSGIGNQESGIRNANQLLNSLPNNNGNPTENLIMFTDEADTLVPGLAPDGLNNGKRGVQLAEQQFDNMIKNAKEKNYKPVVIFHNDQTNQYVAIDLTNLKQKLAEKGKSFADVCSFYQNKGTAIDFNKVASILGLEWKTKMEDLQF